MHWRLRDAYEHAVETGFVGTREEWVQAISNDGEYRIQATNPVMGAINAEMSTLTPRFYDSRLVLPLTGDGISWPRQGNISALWTIGHGYLRGESWQSSGLGCDYYYRRVRC